MDGNYEFDIIDEFGNYVSSRDKTNLAPVHFVKNSKNVYKKVSGNIANRPGLKAYGSLDATAAGVKSAWVWQTTLGLTFPLRVANGKLQVLSSIVDSAIPVWYDLMTDAATLSRYVFDQYYNTVLSKDVLVMVRGDSNLYSWSGGMALMASASAAAGYVTGVSVNTAGGPGYAQSNTLRVLAANNDLLLTIASVSGGFAVTGVTIFQGGTGYVVASNLATYDVTNNGLGTGCTINVTSVAPYSLTVAGSKTLEQLGFDSTGSIIVNGNTYSYTAIWGNTFYGLSSDASAEPAGGVIIQKVVTTSNTPDADFTNDFIRVLQSQLFVGSYTNNKVWISADGTVANADFTDFTNTGSLVTGDPDFAILDTPPTGMIPRDGNMYISGGISDWYIVTPNSPLPVAVSLGGGSSQFVQTLVKKLPGTGRSGALAHEFITIVGNNIVYLSQDQQLRTLGSFRNIFDVKFPDLSQVVKDEFDEEDFTGGHIFADGDFIYLTAPVNSRHWMYETRENLSEEGNITAQRIWHPPQISGISRFVDIGGILYGHSNTNPMIYQIWDTDQWYDDSATGDQIPYECALAMAYMHLTNKGGKSFRRQGKINFDKVYIEGYMTRGTRLLANILYDYQGATDVQTVYINAPAIGGIPVQPYPVKDVKLYSYLTAPSVGQDALADNPIGEGITRSSSAQDYLPKFRAIRKVEMQDCYEYSIEIYSYDIGARFEIEAIGTNLRLSERIARELL